MIFGYCTHAVTSIILYHMFIRFVFVLTCRDIVDASSEQVSSTSHSCSKKRRKDIVIVTIGSQKQEGRDDGCIRSKILRAAHSVQHSQPI